MRAVWLDLLCSFVALLLLTRAAIAGETPGNASGATPKAASTPSTSVSSGAVGAAPSAGSVGSLLAGQTPSQPFNLFNPKTWPFSFVPVPEVATDPNAGTTAGLLPVLLFNQDHRIHDIIAPDINENTIMGAGGAFRFFSYPSEDTQWYAILGGSQNIARKVDLDYSTGRTHSELWSFEGRFYFERDPTERFFGIGNETQHGGETNFTTEQLYALGNLGLNITPNLQIALIERPRYIRIFNGALSTLPFIGKKYPHVKGLDGGTELPQRLLLSYDTRDSLDIPRHGSLFRLFGTVADRGFLSSVSYTQLGGEVRHYVPLGKRFTFASHLFLQYTPAGNETPFWAMGRLGGEDSLLWDQQTLRGYGAGRFRDNNISLANVEMRTRVFDHEIFGTHGILELAPFLEAGRVFHDVSDDPVTRLHPVGGVGFRGIAEPFVVGYVDVGVGGEGTAIFSGLNYPF
jgi:Omp85 superfamily domain